jgi:hypothetical protein
VAVVVAGVVVRVAWAMVVVVVVGTWPWVREVGLVVVAAVAAAVGSSMLESCR